MSDADAAQLVFKLGTRKAKKIIEAARTDAEVTKVTELLRLVRDIKPEDDSAPDET